MRVIRKSSVLTTHTEWLLDVWLKHSAQYIYRGMIEHWQHGPGFNSEGMLAFHFLFCTSQHCGVFIWRWGKMLRKTRSMAFLLMFLVDIQWLIPLPPPPLLTWTQSSHTNLYSQHPCILTPSLFKMLMSMPGPSSTSHITGSWFPSSAAMCRGVHW